MFISTGVNSYMLEYAVRMTPNIGESLSGGTLIQTLNVFTFIQMRLTEACFEGKPKKDVINVTMICLYVILFLALVCIIFVKRDFSKT